MKIISNELVPVYETDQGEHIVDGRELHGYLEVGKDFTSWMKDRIEKFGFEDGVDYSLTLTKIGERQNVTRHDYTLKLDMAKEVAMLENNEKGSMARKYFITVEKKFKSQVVDTSHLSPSLQMFKQLWDGMAQKEFEDKRRDQEINALKEGMSTMQDTLLSRDEDWRNSINGMLNSAAFRLGGKYSDLRSESYKILEERAHCDLNRRLRGIKDRLAESGATKSKIESMTRMDVIEADPKIREIYTSIVKELSIGSLKIAK